MAIVGAVGGKANLGSEHLCGNDTQIVRPLSAVMRKLRELHPHKTSAHIAARARVTARSAEYWLADDRDMSAEAFVNLLLSDDGAEILEAIMFALPKRDRPMWWRRHANTARMAALEHSLAEADEEMKQLRLDLARK